MNSENSVFSNTASVVWLSGEDRLDFLQRMSTNRLTGLAPGTGRATVITSDTGRAVDLVTCHASDDGLALITSHPAGAPAIAAHLKRYVMYGDKVNITDASDQVTLQRHLGSGVAGLISSAFDLDAAELPAGAFVHIDPTVWLLKHPEPGGMGGYDLVSPAGESVDALALKRPLAGAKVGTAEDYARMRIARLLPAYGAEIDGSSNPLELGLRDLVDFEKGCYIGQEVVARVEHYDKLQRRLVRLRAEFELKPGDALHPEPGAGVRGRPGRVSTAVESDAGMRWLAMGFVPRGALVEGAGFDVRRDGEALGTARWTA